MVKSNNCCWAVSRRPGEMPFVCCDTREVAMGYAEACAETVKPFDGEKPEDVAKRLVTFVPFVWDDVPGEA